MKYRRQRCKPMYASVKERVQVTGKSTANSRRLSACSDLAICSEKIVRKPHVPRLEERNVRQGFFEGAEFNALLAALPAYLRHPLTFAFWTGWRVQSEILTLKWEQVDLDEGTVRLYAGTTKNNEPRLIFLPDELRAVLGGQWSEHLTLHPNCCLVFHRNGQKIKDLRGIWARACREAGLSGKIPHDLRRTAVRNLVRSGVSERVAMRISGYKTRDVFDRYDIVSEGDLREAARRLSKGLGTRTGTILDTVSDQEPVLKPKTH